LHKKLSETEVSDDSAPTLPASLVLPLRPASYSLFQLCQENFSPAMEKGLRRSQKVKSAHWWVL